MKTYLELLKNDYKYLNDIRYYIDCRKNIYNLEFDPILLRTIGDYYINQLDYHKTIINILDTHYMYHAEEFESKNAKQYIIKDISEYKKAIIDIIDECMCNLSDVIDKEKKHV